MPQRGQAMSPEQREKIAAALRGRRQSPEHAAKLGEIRRHRRKVAEWLPEHSRSAARRASQRGEIPPADHCDFDPAHEGPFTFDHCGSPPYAWENRLVVQRLCNPCHQQLEAKRRDGQGYSNRTRRECTCEYCGRIFHAAPSRPNPRYCSRTCYASGEGKRHDGTHGVLPPR